MINVFSSVAALILGVMFALLVVPFFGGCFLYLASKIVRLPGVGFIRCWMAYLAAYFSASVVITAIVLLMVDRSKFMVGSIYLPVVPFVILYVIAIAVHMAVVPWILRTRVLKAILAHGIAIALYTAMIIALCVPAMNAAQREARKTITRANLHQIALAMHFFAADHDGHLPPQALRGKDGASLLSWRVLLLPSLGQEALYERFKLDEPWDSPANKTLLGEMPRIYALGGDAATTCMTHFQVFVAQLRDGEHPLSSPNATPFTRIPGAEQMEGLRESDIIHSASTLLVVEGGAAVPWTKPADLPYSPQAPLPRLGAQSKDGFLANQADGATIFWPLRSGEDEKRLREQIVLRRN
ncbi:MAG: DUF1559 domain-containing protein [Candidatus Sumerlaeota bacterium]|nr:DUF1559 domain-containing protein [Candidatus Sumerlaeota bacterium]